MLKTNSNAYRNAIAEYIRKSIDTGAIETDDNQQTLKQCLEYAAARFSTEFGHEYNRRRWPNLQQRLAEYLSGLPFGFAFAYGDIIATAARLHGVERIPANKESTICAQWWNHLALHMIREGGRIGVKF